MKNTITTFKKAKENKEKLTKEQPDLGIPLNNVNV